MTVRGWVSIETVLRAHSADLTEEAARRAPVEARPDVCKRNHPRADPERRCPDCAQVNRLTRKLRELRQHREASAAG